MICTFFGHRNCPVWIKPKLKETLTELIESRSADTFYVGDNGDFEPEK